MLKLLLHQDVTETPQMMMINLFLMLHVEHLSTNTDVVFELPARQFHFLAVTLWFGDVCVYTFECLNILF